MAAVWVLGLTEELGSAGGSERDFQRVVPFMSVVIDSI